MYGGMAEMKKSAEYYKKVQAVLDDFYKKNGECCAGCDFWRWYNSLSGDCIKSAPVSGKDRISMSGIYGLSLESCAGHVVTNRAHVCGAFRDADRKPEFDLFDIQKKWRKKMKLCGCKETCFERGEQLGHFEGVMCANLYEEDGKNHCTKDESEVRLYTTQKEHEELKNDPRHQELID